MLTVTVAAGSHLARLLNEADAPDTACLRILFDGDDFVLRADTPRPGDATFSHHGRTVLALDEQIAKSLADRALDMETSKEEPQLVLL